MSESDLPTDPGGSDPPHQIDLVAEMRGMLSNLLDEKIGGLRTEIVDATAAAAQVGEQLHRFNTNIEALRHEVLNIQKRVTLLEERVDDIERKA